MSDLDRLLADLDATTGLAVDADLGLELTTATGASSTARITGHGQQIRIEAQRPEVLLAAVDRTDVGRAADLLTATGITVTVHGPTGLVATLGAATAGTSNRLGRAVTGSSRVAPVPRAALQLALKGTPARIAAFAVPGALTVLAVIRWLLRRSERH